ncbi:NUDIX hydrolase [Thalassorhabdomicrobium marinisediminis]|uniref:NUDIX hydrolase n=1 Tax=Thalassorhabdomicrobium marinisediminis TaxID=2170577 RepID=A0A2T7FYK5_9RHOB|nr:NUDIX hydrolase [Thalassorhabdomicrobium marinisediminis]PVA07245.1 NUDIX hydrolase [Thalassorhabdomicrobium marinisediminis]
MLKLDRLFRDYVAPMFRRPKRLQVAALCHRTGKRGKEVLLVTSRGTGRWIIPKGWPIRGLASSEAAMQEAWEEAGVKGDTPQDQAIGTYSYDKWSNSGLPVPVEALVYSVEVDSLAQDFPEAHQRRRRWATPAEAATLVDEPELKSIFRNIDS